MQNKSNIKILAIESSCDETAASVIGVENGQPKILSNIVSSQVNLHALTGGVVPEVASRAHVEAIVPVISEALLVSVIPTKVEESSNSQKISPCASLSRDDNLVDFQKATKILQKEIDYIAVTSGPGLIGSLLVGFNAAKTLAYALDKPIVPINHIEGHIYSVFSLIDKEIEFPIISLTVSGGHTSLTLMKNHGEYQTLGETIDDAAGEAFDKVAKLLDLGYPGGPIVSKYAGQFREKSTSSKIVFPRPILNDGTFNFSFSGLKTSVLQKVTEIKRDLFISRHPERLKGAEGSQRFFADAQNDIREVELSDEIKQEVCAAFEDAVVDVLVTKTMRAVEKHEPKAVILAGGVAANRCLREALESKVNIRKSVEFLIPPMNLCGDNAAMIGLAAYYHILRGDISDWNDIEVDSNLELKSDNS